MGFKDKVCVITGGANGIGLSTVNEFIKQGAKVAFIDIDKKSGEEVLKNIKKSGGDAFFFLGDIAEEEKLNSFVEAVIQKYSRIDYLINNACISKKGIISGCSYEDFNYVLKIGVTAPYMLTKLFLNKFNSNAAIVNISSTRAHMSQMDTESYTAAKGGIGALTHALAISLSGKVRVNSISPGWIETNINNVQNHTPEDEKQHPVQRVGNPLDIVKAIMFLCSEENSFINGQDIVVDGGMSKLMIYNEDFGWKYTTE